MDHPLVFGEPKFENYTTQTTCRLGKKWNDRLSLGDQPELEDGDGQRIGRAKVCGLLLAPFHRMPIGWIAMHHLPRVATSVDLAEEMKSIYGEDFSLTADCTLIAFQPAFN